MEAAKNAAVAVINHSFAHLIDPAKYTIDKDHLLYPEMLFGLNIDEFGRLINNYLSARNPFTGANAVFLTNSMAQEIYETNKPGVGIADIRFNTFLKSEQEGYAIIKFKQYRQDDKMLHPDVMPLIKLPEMYYIAAEYYADQHNVSKAVHYLNSVRKARGIKQMISKSATVQKVKKEILQAYRKEYVMEGQLFFFYKRKGVKHIPGYGVSQPVGENIYMLPMPLIEKTYR